MAWLRIDDAFAEHTKVAGLSDRSFRLHIVALCYCARNLTDGVLDKKATKIVRVVASAGPKNVAELIAAKLWNTHGDGHKINDYGDYNETAADIKKRREQTRLRVQKHRSNQQGNGATGTDTTRATPRTRVPVPSLTTSSEASSHYADDDLQTAIKRLHGTPGQQLAWLTAARAEPDRIAACLAAAERGENATAYFATLVTSGEWPSTKPKPIRENQGAYRPFREQFDGEAA